MDESKKSQKRRFIRLGVFLPVKYSKFTNNPIFQGF